MLGGAAASPWDALAQDGQEQHPVIGYHNGRSEQADAPFTAGLRRGLAESGGNMDKRVIFEFRWGDNDATRIESLAAELIARKPAVIFAGGGVGTALVAKKLTQAIPIVFVNGGDPIKVGLVRSMSRPEANVTGVSFLATQIVSKRLELLLDFVPKAKLLAALVNPRNPDYASMARDVDAAKRTFKVEFKIYEASVERDIDMAFADMATRRPDALLIGGDAFFAGMRRKLIALSTRYVLPSMFDVREFAAEGGLMSYGSSQTDAYRQAGLYIGRILRGAKPADLPVLQSTRFELIINVATAKALGLEVPNKLMALADEIIE